MRATFKFVVGYDADDHPIWESWVEEFQEGESPRAVAARAYAAATNRARQRSFGPSRQGEFDEYVAWGQRGARIVTVRIDEI